MTTASSTDEFEQNYFIRRDQSVGRSYRLAITPYPGECLVDIMIRAACENGFPPSMSCRMIDVPQLTLNGPTRNRYDITPEALTTLLGNRGGPDEVRHLLHNDLPPRKHLRPFFDTWIDEKAFMAARRVSPRALRKAPYLRAMWRIFPVGFDPDTKEMLISHCPVCTRRLAATFMGDVWCCDRCSHISEEGELRAVDLREHDQCLVGEDLWKDLDFVTSMIDPTAMELRRKERSRMHKDFDDLSNGEIFEVIYAIARSLPGSLAPARNIPPENLALAGAIVRGWPETVEAHFANGRDSGRTTDWEYKGIIHNSRLNAGIRARIQQICRASYVRMALKSPPETNPSTSEYRLVRNWISRGALETSSKINVEAILVRSRPDVRTVAEKIGISIPTFFSMSDGTFFPLQPASDRARSDLPHYTDRLVRFIGMNAQNSPVPKHAIRLPRAVSSLYLRADDPWNEIVSAMLSGRIRYWITDRWGSSLLEKVYVEDMAEVHATLSGIPRRVDPVQTIPLSRREVGSKIRLYDTGFSAVLRAGLISPPFNAEMIAKFLGDFEPSNLFTVRYLPGKQRMLMPDVIHSLTKSGIKSVTLSYSGTISVWSRAAIEGHFGSDLMPCIR
ncbi:hypothetical protein [Pararhizobium sp. PWRC1-1]|uniref:hypothetical protein n=1 Tax=Pararhizobium sp. PWRC1-1 TaxID=2804566 RepID=UPI003CEBDFCF